MDIIELDHEIIITKEAIKELIEINDYGALKLAQSDLSYLISLLNN